MMSRTTVLGGSWCCSSWYMPQLCTMATVALCLCLAFCLALTVAFTVALTLVYS